MQHIHPHWSTTEEPSTVISERCQRARINSAIFVSSEGRGFDSIEFIRRYGSQSVLCRKAKSAENIPSGNQNVSSMYFHFPLALGLCSAEPANIFIWMFAFWFPNSVVSLRIPRTEFGKSRKLHSARKLSWSSVITSRRRQRIKFQTVQR